MPEEIYSTSELAEMLGVPVSTVYRWNTLGTGPRPLRVGKHCRYRARDVDTWLEQRAVDTRRPA